MYKPAFDVQSMTHPTDPYDAFIRLQPGSPTCNAYDNTLGVAASKPGRTATCKALHVELVFHWHGCLCLLQLQPLSCCLEGSLHLIYLTITAGLCCISRICRCCWYLADKPHVRHTGCYCRDRCQTGGLQVILCVFEEAAFLTRQQ